MKKQCKWILETLSECYLFIIILIFPLLVGTKGYQNILDVKYYFYTFITILYILSILLVLMYFLIIKKINYFKNIKLKKIHLLLFIFLLINIFSYIFSPYKNYNLLIGLGRGEGLISIFLYTVSSLLLSLFLKYDKKYLCYFSISSILISFIAILQYLGFNPFYIFKGHTGPFNMSFMTTLGNKDIISAYYTITLSLSFCSFVLLDNSFKENIFHLLSLLFGLFIFFVINVDSGLVAFLLILFLLIPIILLNSKYLYKVMIVGGLINISLVLNYILNPVYRYTTRIYKLELQFDKYSFLLLLISFFFLLTGLYIRKHAYIIKDTKLFLRRMYISYPILIIGGILVIYLYSFNIPLLVDIQKILHGNITDEIGTYRVFLWKRSISLVKDYPLIGTGPDTFAMRFMSKYLVDVIRLDGRITINDTAANTYLTMLVNIGIVGLLSYLSFIIGLLRSLFKNLNNNKYALIFIVTIICFLVQDFFNLSVVIVTPIYYSLLSLSISCIDNKKCFWYTFCVIIRRSL